MLFFERDSRYDEQGRLLKTRKPDFCLALAADKCLIKVDLDRLESQFEAAYWGINNQAIYCHLERRY